MAHGAQHPPARRINIVGTKRASPSRPGNSVHFSGSKLSVPAHHPVAAIPPPARGMWEALASRRSGNVTDPSYVLGVLILSAQSGHPGSGPVATYVFHMTDPVSSALRRCIWTSMESGIPAIQRIFCSSSKMYRPHSPMSSNAGAKRTFPPLSTSR